MLRNGYLCLLILVILHEKQEVFAAYKIVYKGPGKYTYETDPITKGIGECVTLEALSNYKTNGSEIITWKKDTHELTDTNRIKISGGSVYITSLELSDHAFYEATTKNYFSNVIETTDIYLHVKGCGKHQKELSPISPSSCKTLCEEKCPSEWVYVVGTDSKCCQYFGGQGETWSKASENCQAIGGELTTIDNEVENKFISNMLQTATGAWIGLNDRESEASYVWNFKQYTTQTYFTWGNGEPSNYNGNCNIENCVSIKTNGKWNDVVCNSFNPFVCQVSISYNKSDVSEWSCLSDFCYKMFNDQLVWREAVDRCRSVHGSGNLAAITSSGINALVTALINEQSWIGLNDIREAGSYKWHGFSSSSSYKNWDFGEPNDMFYRDQLLSCPGEDCVQIKKFSGNVSWHDLGCDTVLPYICERVRDRAFSTGSYVAMVIGSFLLVFMIVGGIHAAYQKRQRTAVKDIIKAAFQQDIKLREAVEEEETIEERIPRKISFKSAARMVVPSIRIQHQR